MLAKGMNPHPLSGAFTESITYQIAMKNDEPNIKEERVNLRISLQFIAKWKTTFAFQQKFGCCSTSYETCP